jgi:UDP-N-acetylglucosamine--dolichyl-phosphate N-acetylglucosaminephosphotransferase
MFEKVLLLPFLLSFLVTLFVLPYWIKKAKSAGLIGKDIHKLDKREVAEGGGIAVLMGFVFGTLFYIALKTFVLKTDVTTVEIFALLTTIIIVGVIGFVDDVLVWRVGLRWRIRIFLLIFAAIPLMVINAGESTMMGIDFGLIYPLLFIPLGIVGTTATFNFLAGYNGLEASQGMIILIALSIVTWLTGNSWLAVISLIMVFCLIAFYIFNKNPASVFPGDVLTYPLGALIGIIAILGNIEKMAIFFFIPYILEVGLKVRGKIQKQSFGKLNEDGSLEVPYKKFYGLEHVSIWLLKRFKKDGKAYEKEVVWLINLFQIVVILLGFALFGLHLI